MKKFAVQKSIQNIDIKRARNKLKMTQQEFAELVNVSKKTIERWEAGEKEITGPITTLLHLLENDVELAEDLQIPDMKYPLRITYLFRNEICTILDVDERQRKLSITNYKRDCFYRAFGRNEQPNYEQYEAFLESRCFPRTRDKMKLMLNELNIPFYDPMLIIQKTEGRMAEDEFWLRLERRAEDNDRVI